MRRAALGLLVMAAALLSIGAARPMAWSWHLPSGVKPPPVPADNPMSVAKVELGRRLFYDADLSIDGTMSCATCHSQRHGFADNNRTRAGVHGEAGRRNVPGLANVAWASPLTWADPHLTTLEMHVAVPVLGDKPVEMGMKGQEQEIARRLASDACYVRMFQAAFPEAGGAIDMVTVAKALAGFQRTMITFDTPFDRYQRGDRDALTDAARRGAVLFEGRAGCASCHTGPNFTDMAFHKLDTSGDRRDPGLGELTGSSADDGKFRTPGLRNVALTAPYMHNGEARTLADAIDRHRMSGAVGDLSPDDRTDLIAFLGGALTDQAFIANARLAMPAKACGRRL